MRRMILGFCILGLVVVSAMLMIGICGCVKNPVLDLPNLGYADPRAHAGRDIEAEQGIVRGTEGWINSRGAKYRVVKINGKPVLEWTVYASNPTDMPRKATAVVVASFENYEPYAKECLVAKDFGTTILSPNASGGINGATAVPNDCLRGFSYQLSQPAPAPKVDGPVVTRCVQVKDGSAIIEWKATVASASHQLTATFTDQNGKKYIQKELLAPVSYDVTAVFYNDMGREIARSKLNVPVGADRMVLAKGRVELSLENASEIAKVTVQWEAVHAEKAKAEARVKRFRVTAYCPCGRCTDGDGITANGGDAKLPGVAADKMYAFGRVLDVPDYGPAVVDDRGRAIVGNRLDVRMKTHRQAKAWGVRNLDVTILE